MATQPKDLACQPGSSSFVSDETACALCGGNHRAMLVSQNPLEEVAPVVPKEEVNIFGLINTSEDTKSSGDGAIKLPLPAPVRKGICEPCAVFAYWKWRSEPSEIPPGFDLESSKTVTKVYVIVPKLRTPKSEGEVFNPEMPESYDCLMVQSRSRFDLPSISNDSNVKKDAVAAKDALIQAGVISWVPCLETLYQGYNQRGRLVSVVLATAWTLEADLKQPKGSWRKWPLEEHVDPGLAGFYKSLTEVFRLRLFKHMKMSSDRPLAIQVRKSAADYMATKHDLREAQGNPELIANIDTSMMPLLRKVMTPDEVFVDRIVTQWEDQHGELAAQMQKDAVEQSETTLINQDDDGDGAQEDGSDDDADTGDSGSGERSDDEDRSSTSDEASSPAGGVVHVSSNKGQHDDDEDGEGWPAEVVARAQVEGKVDTKVPAGFVRRGLPLTTDKG